MIRMILAYRMEFTGLSRLSRFARFRALPGQEMSVRGCGGARDGIHYGGERIGIATRCAGDS
jgi:hypothetical protein